MGYKPLTNWDAHHSRIHGPVATQLADDGETTCFWHCMLWQWVKTLYPW